METQTVHIWTDGACIRNPGPGGWAYLKTLNGKTFKRSGYVAAKTTNIEMEMVAVIQALRSLSRTDLPTIVYTDLDMIPKGMNEWMPNWIANGWRNSQKQPVAKKAQWEALKALRDARAPGAEITFVWVRGHSGQPQNEEVDRLAETAARQAARELGGASTMPTRFDPASGLMVPDFELDDA